MYALVLHNAAQSPTALIKVILKKKQQAEISIHINL